MMTGNGTPDRKRDRRKRNEDPMGDESGREVTHQRSSEEKSVERTADHADHRSNAIVDQGVVRRRRLPPREGVTIEHRGGDDGDDGRDLGKKSIADSA